jgi:hypothetical protein
VIEGNLKISGFFLSASQLPKGYDEDKDIANAKY